MAKVPKSMFQVPLVGFFSGKDEVLCTLEHRPLLKLGVVVVQDVRAMNSVSCCPHKYLGRLVGGGKRGCVLLHHFWTLGTRAVSPVPFLKKGDRRRKVMLSGNPFRGNTKKTKCFACFNQIFIRGVNRRLYPLAVLQADECTHCVKQS